MPAVREQRSERLAPPFARYGQRERRRQCRNRCKALGLAVAPFCIAACRRWRRPRSPTRASRPRDRARHASGSVRPDQVWGVPVSNGMKMAVEEINAAGGINGRKLKLIVEDIGYDPKQARAGLAEAGRAGQDLRMLARWARRPCWPRRTSCSRPAFPSSFPLTSAEFTYKIDPAKPQDRLKFNNVPPYIESTRAAPKY